MIPALAERFWWLAPGRALVFPIFAPTGLFVRTSRPTSRESCAVDFK